MPSSKIDSIESLYFIRNFAIRIKDKYLHKLCPDCWVLLSPLDCCSCGSSCSGKWVSLGDIKSEVGKRKQDLDHMTLSDVFYKYAQSKSKVMENGKVQIPLFLTNERLQKI